MQLTELSPQARAALLFPSPLEYGGHASRRTPRDKASQYMARLCGFVNQSSGVEFA